MRRAPHAARFLHPEGHDYFAMLREKLHWSETPGAAARQVGPDRPQRQALGASTMLRLLSIRNFVVVEALDLELDARLLGAHRRNRRRQVDPARRARPAPRRSVRAAAAASRAPSAPSSPAAFDVDDAPDVGAWLAAQGPRRRRRRALLLRRTLDAQGRSRAWINGRPATLAQLKDVGERLVDLHGQHAHQSLAAREAQRALVDAFGGFTALARETGDCVARVARRRREARDAAAAALQAIAAEREALEARRRELAALDVSADEWASLTQAQSRLAHAAALIEAATRRRGGADRGRRRALRARLVGADREARRAVAAHDPALPRSSRCSSRRASRSTRPRARCAAIGRSSTSIPAELARDRGAARGDPRRRAQAPRAARSAAGAAGARPRRGSRRSPNPPTPRRSRSAPPRPRRVSRARRRSSRRSASSPRTSSRRASREAMQKLAMAGGRLEIALEPLATPGELRRRAGRVPRREPSEAAARAAGEGGVGRRAVADRARDPGRDERGRRGADARSSTRSMPASAAPSRRPSAICCRRWARAGRCSASRTCRRSRRSPTRISASPSTATTTRCAPTSRRLQAPARVEELARMLAGSAITAKTRAHAKELFERHRRGE